MRQPCDSTRFGVNFNDVPNWQKRGVGLYWETFEKDAFNPKTGEAVKATRRRIKRDFDLPMKEEYGRFVEAWRGCDAAQSSVRETARARIAAITQLARATLVALPLASPPANGAVGKRSPP